MIKRYLILLFLIAVIFSSNNITGNSLPRDHTDTLKVRGDFNYPPYEFLENGIPKGFNVDLISAVAEEMGLVIDLKLGPWHVLREELETGHVDIMSGMFYSEERDKLVDFSTPYLVVSHSIFVKKGSAIRTLQDLRGKKILTQKGDIMDDYVRQNYPPENVISMESQYDALLVLSSGEADAAILGKLQAYYLADRMNMQNIEAVGPPLEPMEYCFAVPEGRKNLLAELNEGLVIIKKTGKYDELHEKWFGIYTEDTLLESIGRYSLLGISALTIIVGLLIAWNSSLKKKVYEKTKELRKELQQREIAENETRTQKELYEKLVTTIPDIVIRTDIEGIILFANDVVEENPWLSGKDEIIGKNILTFIASEDQEKASINFQRMFNKSLGIVEYNLKFGELNGIFEVNGEVLRDHNEIPYGLVFVLREVTQKKKLITELITAKEKAEKSDEFKSAFLAQISHEIRTPINTILSFSSLIRQSVNGALDEDMQFGFNSIGNAGKRIIRTIDLLLNMSAIQTGNYDPVLKDMELKTILSAVIDEMNPAAKEKNILLEYSFVGSDFAIKGDEYSLSQIFINLVDNAIKYTNEGKVIVKITEANDILTVEVTDTGIGIAEEFLPDLFSPFVQEESGYTRRYEGNGLGLALVKEYCSINRAEISVKSKKGIGTSFFVNFQHTSHKQTI